MHLASASSSGTFDEPGPFYQPALQVRRQCPGACRTWPEGTSATRLPEPSPPSRVTSVGHRAAAGRRGDLRLLERNRRDRDRRASASGRDRDRSRSSRRASAGPACSPHAPRPDRSAPRCSSPIGIRPRSTAWSPGSSGRSRLPSGRRMGARPSSSWSPSRRSGRDRRPVDGRAGPAGRSPWTASSRGGARSRATDCSSRS